MSIISIGTGALAAAQAGLLTTGHNIANANTAGYSRQQIQQVANPALYSGGGYIGNGVSVNTIQRQYSSLLVAEVQIAQSQASQSQAWLDGLSKIDGMLADPATGLSSAIDDFFSGVNDVASNPADAATRQNMLSAAQELAGRLHDLDGQLAQARASANSQISQGVSQVNALAQQIAQLNRAIAVAGGSGPSAQPPNDLLDQRDQLVTQLSQQVGVSVVPADDGSYNLFLGSGQALVLGATSFALAARADPQDAQNLQVGLQTGAGFVQFDARSLTGGTLGGVLAFRDQTLPLAQNALGRIAIAVGTAVNAQNRLGVDANGAPGGDLFAIGSPTVLSTSAATLSATITDSSQLTTSDYKLIYDGSNYTLTRLQDGQATTFATFPQTVDGLTLNLSGPAPAANDRFLIQPTRSGASALQVIASDPSQIATAVPVRTSTGTANTGMATISAGSIGAAYLAVPLGAAVTLTYDAATGTLSGLPATAPFAYVPGAPMSWNGIAFSISGTPNNGDTFTLAPNTNASGDNRNALALAALQTTALLGGATLQQSYAALTGAIGSSTQQQQASVDSQNNLLTQAQAAQQSLSGVNLDEEASDLMRYQQAYQAAGKLIGVAATLFDTILSIGQ